MRIEVFVAVDGNENVGIADTAENAIEAIDDGSGPDVGVPIAVAKFDVEISVPTLAVGPTVEVPDDGAQIIQPELTTEEKQKYG